MGGAAQQFPEVMHSFDDSRLFLPIFIDNDFEKQVRIYRLQYVFFDDEPGSGRWRIGADGERRIRCY
jgi:hypothetical protein